MGNNISKALVKRTTRGMATAEYAVGTLAAVGFAGVLFKIITDPKIADLLFQLFRAILEAWMKWGH